MGTYVMGDVHGAFKAMVQCLHRAGFNYEQDTLIQLGDVTDGYDQVFDCVEELLKIKHLITIRGNHDDWFLHFLQTGHHPQNWAQGGEATLRSYLKAIGQEDLVPLYGNAPAYALRPEAVPDSHRRFFAHQRLYYIDSEQNCFVHAGFDRHKAITDQHPQVYYWDRDLWQEALSWQAANRKKIRKTNFRMATTFKAIFIGHTRTTMWGTDQPMKAANIYNIDTGGGGGGRVTLMDVATHEYWQSDPVAELYAFSYR